MQKQRATQEAERQMPTAMREAWMPRQRAMQEHWTQKRTARKEAWMLMERQVVEMQKAMREGWMAYLPWSRRYRPAR